MTWMGEAGRDTGGGGGVRGGCDMTWMGEARCPL